MVKQSSLKILIVDDETALAEAVKKILELQNFDVKTAASGGAAKNLIALESFDLVLSDIRMPQISGIELLHFIKKTKPDTPVVLMTGFNELSDAKEAAELGAKGFLSKPFQEKELLELIHTVCAGKIDTAPIVEEENLDDQYVGLRIDEFVSGKEIKYDIFVRLSQSKYVKVASSGESIEIERVTQYRSKNLSHLYLRKDDFHKYTGFMVVLADKVAASPAIDQTRKCKYLVQTAKSMIQNIYADSVNRDAFDAATDLVVTTISVLGENPNVFSLFEILKDCSDGLYAHSVAVSVYSVLTAKSAGWKSPRFCMKIAACAIMHDIGYKELPKDLLQKSRVSLSAEEVKLLETHTVKGMEILNTIPGIPEEVPLVALQHHEDCKGLGYPARITKNHIIPVARLIGLVDEFCELAFPSLNSPGLGPVTAAKRLSSVSSRFDPEYYSALMKLLGHYR